MTPNGRWEVVDTNDALVFRLKPPVIVQIMSEKILDWRWDIRFFSGRATACSLQIRRTYRHVFVQYSISEASLLVGADCAGSHRPVRDESHANHDVLHSEARYGDTDASLSGCDEPIAPNRIAL